MSETFVLPNSGHNRDDVASKMGMWLFLFTELLLFGGLFLVYLIYRYVNPEDFFNAHLDLNVVPLLERRRRLVPLLHELFDLRIRWLGSSLHLSADR